jgi:hypothetical protein
VVGTPPLTVAAFTPGTTKDRNRAPGASDLDKEQRKRLAVRELD